VASLKGLQSGDIILSVDGVSLEKQPLDKSRDLLRGQAGSTVSLVVLKQDGEIWSGVLTRTGMKTVDLDAVKDASAKGNTQTIPLARVRTQADATGSSEYSLIGLLQQGKVLDESSSISNEKVRAVYAKVSADPKLLQSTIGSMMELNQFDRNLISLSLSKSGLTKIQIFDATGVQVASWTIDANSGELSMPWNGKALGSGAYSLTISQGSSKTGFPVKLD